MATPVHSIDGPSPLDQPEDDEPESWGHRFAQRRLKAWQPILAPRRVIACYIVSGLLFFGIGIVLLLTSRSVEEYVVDYTDLPTNRHGVGTFDIQVVSDMEPPIWVYYQLDGFHQNHRRYVKSRSNSQLGEGTVPPKTAEQDLTECIPWVTTGERINYPCGVIAKSVFNDTYALSVRTPQAAPGERLAIDSRARTIAWDADTQGGKFVNQNPEAHNGHALANQVLLNMWLLQRFPPAVCEQEIISQEKPFVPVYVATKNVTLQRDPATNKTERQIPITDCSGYTSDEPHCNFVRDGQPFNCSGDYKQVRVNDWGIESGHFIVWMRVAGLPSFMKLWGRIDTPIKAGSTVTVNFVSNFPVKPFDGRKAIVLSTASVLGGRNDFLGLGYLAVGGCCLVFGLAFLWRHIAKPRPLGDVSLLCRNYAAK
jgi:hypothetical protein